MSDRTQIGPSVDAELWERFRKNVKDRKGNLRGSLGSELENAIRQYLGDSVSPANREVNARLSRIEEALDIPESDGGLQSSNPETHTRAKRLTEPLTEKPAANTSTEKKVRYLAHCILESEVPQTRELQQVPKDTIRDIVKEEYGFRRDTARRYVEELIEWFDLTEHPAVDGILVTPDEYNRIMNDRKESAADKAESEMEELTE